MPKVNYARRSDDIMALETAILAGGCFWCLQPIFQELKGVHRAECGYSGGHVDDPTYEQVCTGSTGHAEAVQVTFDPAMTTFEDILRVFFAVHDPTTLNQQGPDRGTQYRSAIFYHSTDQRTMAEQLIAGLNEDDPWGRPIVTEVVPLAAFYRAEDYHQDYFKKNPNGGYCVAVIAPKMEKFRKDFQGKLNE